LFSTERTALKSPIETFWRKIIVFCGRKSRINKRKVDFYFQIKWLSSYGTSQHTAASVVRVTAG